MRRPAGYSSLRRIGDYKHSARRSDHDGWILCDGRTIQRAAYPSFFEAVEVTAASIVVPDGKDCLLLGAGGRLKVLERGGSNDVTLTIENLPEHDHSFDDATAEATTGKGGLLTGVLQIFTGLTAKTLADKRTKKAGGAKAIKLAPLAIGANVFLYVGEPVA